jgi:hypothetical protein
LGPDHIKALQEAMTNMPIAVAHIVIHMMTKTFAGRRY